MIHINSMKPNKLYLTSGQKLDLRLTKNDTRSTVFVLVNNNREKNLEILKCGIMNPLNSKSFSTDSIFRLVLPGKSIRYRELNKDLYINIKTDPELNILKTNNNIESFNNNPIYYDASPFLSALFNGMEKFPFTTKFKRIFSELTSYINSKFSSYERKIFIFNLDKQIQMNTDLRKETNDILSFILACIKFIPNEKLTEDFLNWEFIVINPITKVRVYFKLKDIAPENPSKTNRILKIIHKGVLDNQETNDNIEIENDNNNKADNIEIDELNNSKADTATDKKELTIDKVPLSIISSKKITKREEVARDIKPTSNLTPEKLIIPKKDTRLTKIDRDNDEIEDIEPDVDALEDIPDEEENDDNEDNEIYPKKVTKDDEDNLEKLVDSLDKETTAENKELEHRRVIRKEKEKKLREDTDKVIVDKKGLTLKEVLSKKDPEKFEDKKINKVQTLNESNKKSTLAQLDEAYVENLMDSDMMSVFNSLSDMNKTIPIFITKIDRKDSSDAFNKKEEITVHFIDGNNVKHTFSVDIPILIDNRFIYLSGSKKIINKQLIALPVVKTGKDRVQITTNYNKTIIMRFGRKVSPKVERFLKFFKTYENRAVKVQEGNNKITNADYTCYLEYDELAARYNYIKIRDYNFIFNQRELNEYIKDKLGITEELPSNMMYIGYMKKEPMIINTVTGEIRNGVSSINFIDFIMSMIFEMDKDIIKKYYSIKISSKYFYTRCSILGHKISMFLILAFREGIIKLLNRMNVKYIFSETKPKFNLEASEKYNIIKFADGYFCYEAYPISNSLILNGLGELPTEELSFKSMDDPETYISFFEMMFNSKAIIKGFDNFAEQLIDPITEKICRDLELPTDFMGLMLYANKLLEDNSKLRENDMSSYRIRSLEVINVMMYKVLMEAYEKYKNTYTNNNPQKISVQKNAVLKMLIADPLIENYSTLNPVSEGESLAAVTWRGVQGLNLDEAYKTAKRSFDPTMLGVIALSSPNSRRVGVNRQITVDPNIISPRGYIKSGSKEDKFNAEDVMSFSEILNPYTTSHDDAPRISMTYAQSGHVVSGQRNDPALITYGADRSLPYILSNDFVNKAKKNGKVIDIKDGFMFIEYDDGTKEVINIGVDIQSNGGGGFFIDNQKSTSLKVGDKFTKNDILAYNTNFFKDCGFGPQYLIGTLTKVGVIGGYFNFEDSTICTESFGKLMTTAITMKQDKILEPNSTVDFIAKKGSHITTGDTLLKFEPAFPEEEMNEFLSVLGDELQQDIEALNRNLKVSKFTGILKDIRIYYTCNYEELSPSLKKIVDDYKKEIDTKHQEIIEFFGGEVSNIILPPTERYSNENGRVKGQDIGKAVLFEFYIEHDDHLGIGSKVTYSTALKAIVSEVIPDSQVPYTESNPDEEVSCLMSPVSINARMTGSVWLQMYGNKVLVELGKKIRKIYEENK